MSPKVARRLRPGAALIPMSGAVQIRIGDEEVHVLRTTEPDRLMRALRRLDGATPRVVAVEPIDAGDAHLLGDLIRDLDAAGLLAPDADPDEAARLRATRIAVLGHARGAELAVQVLAEHGLGAALIARERLAAEAGAASALLCVTEAPDLALCFEVNDAACRARIPCLFADLSHGRHATIGPFYVPGDGACLRCLRARLHENTAAFDELVAAERAMLDSGLPLPAPGCSPSQRHVAVGLAAGEIAAFVTRQRPLRTLNRAITVAFEAAEMWSEPVWRAPWCVSCGTGSCV